MKIRLENVNLNSNSGPNSFAQKLMKYMSKDNHTFVNEGYDAALCFIETYNGIEDNKLFQRLDERTERHIPYDRPWTKRH